MSEHAGLVGTAAKIFPGSTVVARFGYAEFRRACLALLSETVPADWPAADRQVCALRGLALLATLNHGNVRDFAGRLFDEIGAVNA